jgi:hypothetical protein
MRRASAGSGLAPLAAAAVYCWRMLTTVPMKLQVQQ